MVCAAVLTFTLSSDFDCFFNSPQELTKSFQVMQTGNLMSVTLGCLDHTTV